MSRWLVYLLCLPHGDGLDAHYVGITTPERLGKRLMEHRSGRGAKRTRQAWETGEIWYHTASFPTDSRDLEGQLQRDPAVMRLCPRCAAGIAFPAISPYPRPPGLGDRGGWLGY